MHLLYHFRHWLVLIAVVMVAVAASPWEPCFGADESAPAQPNNTLRDPFQPPPLPNAPPPGEPALGAPAPGAPAPGAPATGGPSAGARRVAPSPYSRWQRPDAPPAAAVSAAVPPSPSPNTVATKQVSPTPNVSPEEGGVGGFRVGPQGPAPSTDYPGPVTRQPVAPASTAKPIEGGQIVARVGSEVILASELLWEINRFLREKAGGAPASEIEMARQQMIQTQLMRPPAPGNIGLVDTKLLYGQVRATAPAERLEEVRGNMAEQFESVLIPRLMKFTKAQSREDLETILRRDGSSIAQQRQAFLEREIAMGWLGQQINRNPEITHADMLAYYQENSSDYEYSAKVRWNELMVRFDRFNGDHLAAKRALAAMGNEVLVQNRPFDEVARGSSHGYTASEGGRHDWTGQGSLAAKNIDTALFSLPIGAMSRILESKKGLHVVRVAERKAAGKTPFGDAQVEIQKRLKRDERNRQIGDYLAKLRRQTKVWTAFSGDTTAEALIDAGKSTIRR